MSESDHKQIPSKYIFKLSQKQKPYLKVRIIISRLKECVASDHNN